MLTIKSAGASACRLEFECEILVAQAQEMIGLRMGARIPKVRHIVPAGERAWEIDACEGEKAGLIMAGIELNAADQDFGRSARTGTEVSADPRFSNSALA